MKHMKSAWLLATIFVISVFVVGCVRPAPQAAAPTQTSIIQAPAPEVIPVQSTAPSLTSTELELRLTDLYQRVNPSVVFVLVPPMGSGSGFVISEEGHIVTNNHVIEDGRNYEVVFANGERSRASLVGADADSDLAVIQVENMPEGVSPLPLADPDNIRVGQFAVAIGNPFGEQGSMSLGIVSGLGRSLPSQRGESGLRSTYSLPSVIQTDAPINPGNSGGPLLNLNGEVIGVNAAIASRTGVGSGVGFSIPVAAVSQVAPRLIEEGEYRYAFLGASFDGEISLDELRVYDLDQTQGAYVLGLADDGPADQAGLIAANPSTGQGGDLIVAINGQAINNFDDLNRYLVFNTQPGDVIDVTVVRNGQTVSVPLELGVRP
jgi:2-alkenal reductase